MNCIASYSFFNRLIAAFLLIVASFACEEVEDPDKPDPEVPEEPVPLPQLTELRKDYPGTGVLQVNYDGAGNLTVLTEKLPLLHVYPGLRAFDILDVDGNEKFHLGSEENDILIEAILNEDYVYAAFIRYEGELENLILRKFDLAGKQLLQTTLLSDTESEIDLRVVLSDARASLKVGKERVYVAVFTNRQKVFLRTYSMADFSPVRQPVAVESGGVKGRGDQFAASYDAFHQLSGRYRVWVDIDDDENIYVGVPKSSSKISPVDNGTVFSKFSAEGNLIYTSSAPDSEAIYEAGMQDFKVKDGKVLISGRRLTEKYSTWNDWNPYLEVYDGESGALIFHSSYTLAGNEIFFGVDVDDSTQLAYVGGSAGWSQNPKGASVSEAGAKILLEVGASNGSVRKEIVMTNGPRQNQIRSVQVFENFLILGGWENGPGTHSGDSDPDLVTADGFLQIIYR